MHITLRWIASSFLAVGVAAAAACSSSSNGDAADAGADTGIVTNTGQSCTNVSQCYPGLLDGGPDASLISGATCLTQLQGGYCTHTCSADTDCCSVAGECPSAFKEVCASFESSGQKYCFLSCESADLAADPDSGTSDPTAFCQRWAGSAFTCRSTGGGSQNRQFCGP